MPFDKTKLDPTGSGSRGAGCLGVYDAGADVIATVKGAGYFNAAADSLRQTKILAVVSGNGASIGILKCSVAGNVVTVASVDII
jgi:hypothetical protein